MAERQNLLSNLGLRPVPMNMKLFASGDMDRTPPNCVPRLCNVTVTRLQMMTPPTSDLSSVILAVKMHCSKRTLRSNELPLPPSGTLDAELQLCYSLQYPHFLKREGNNLQILLQRRKKYKNRTILGFKTLAVGLVNMAQVLQRPMDQELDLYVQGKEKGNPVARVKLESLSSQPVDCEDSEPRGGKQFISDNPDRSVDIVEDSEDDPEYSSQDDGSDSEPMLDETTPHHRHRHRQGTNTTARQRNLKQRFVALLKKFKVPEALQAFEADTELDPRADVPVDPDDIEYLMNELEDMSDSGPEVDTLSISSTPKPSLRPYFSSSRSLLVEDLNNTNLAQTSEKPLQEGLSDESSKRGCDSDYLQDYNDHWTDAEHSDNQMVGASSSPPTLHKASLNEPPNGVKESTAPSSSSEGKTKDSTNKSSHKINKSIGSSAALVFNAVSRSGDKRTTSTSSSTNAPMGSTTNIKGEGDTVRKGLVEHLNSILPQDDPKLPPAVILLDTSEYSNSCLGSSLPPLTPSVPSSELSHSALASQLTSAGLRVVTTQSSADVRATMRHLINKLQKFCNSNAKAPGPLKVLIMGCDSYINNVLRPYVEDFSTRPPDYQNHIRFLIVPIGGVSSLAKYIGSVDSSYGASFVSEWWRDAVERWEQSDVQEAVGRIVNYLNSASHTLHLPVAEAVLTYKERSDDDSAQTFIPFVTDVRLGSGDVTSTSVDLDEQQFSALMMSPSSGSSTCVTPAPTTSISSPNSGQTSGGALASQQNSSSNLSSLVNLNTLLSTTVSSSVTPTPSSISSMGGGASSSTIGGSGSLGLPVCQSGGVVDKVKDSTITPPSSPNINTSVHLPTSRTTSECESLDLQVDYWLSARGDKKGADDKDKASYQGRCTLKTSFRTLQVARLAPLGIVLSQDSRDVPAALTFSYATKENKKRIMRIGKKKEKERESESRRDVVDGVTRLLANTKSTPVTVTIDSVEWPNVKFFQLSSQWQTQIKTFPVYVFNLQSASGERA